MTDGSCEGPNRGVQVMRYNHIIEATSGTASTGRDASSGGAAAADRPSGRRRRNRRLLIGAVTMALLAAACGNSEESSTTPKEPTKDSTPEDTGLSNENVPVDAPGVSDTEIRVGGVASVTNRLGGKYGEAFDGAQAYFDMVNEAGGIYGRTISLVAKRDDQLVNNKSEVEGLLGSDDVFAVVPVATLLFTGADLLVEQNVPTFGWAINPEWGGDAENPRSNLFGQSGSFLCFGCASAFLPWLAKETGSKKIGVLAYAVPQSSQCADGIEASFDQFGAAADGAEVAFADKSLAYGEANLSVQVKAMKDAGVDLVTTCMDTNGVTTLAKEMKKQQLDAKQYLPNGYDQEFLDEFGDLFEGSFVRTDFTQWQLPEQDQPEGLRQYLAAMSKAGKEPAENSLAAWMNADLFVEGLKAAGPQFSRQKLIDAINVMTSYKANGLLHGVDWTVAHDRQGDPNLSCQFMSVIRDSQFAPEYSKPGKPFLCVDSTDPTTFAIRNEA